MNYYKKIAEMLGVELGEEFSLKDNKTKNIFRPRYKITQEEGLMYSVNRNEFDRSGSLMSIINGSFSVVKLPWKPKEGDIYWHYSEAWRGAISSKWVGECIDLIYWKVGNCFKNEEEGNAKGKEIVKRIQREYEEA